MQKSKRSQQGSTLIEIMVATTVVVFALTALMATLTLSVKTTAESKYRTYATSLGQEALEVFRRERALLGWTAFHAAVDDGATCYNELPTSSAAFVGTNPGACGDRFTQVGTAFSRTVNATKTTDSVTVQVVVDWYDGSNLRQVTLEQILKEY